MDKNWGRVIRISEKAHSVLKKASKRMGYRTPSKFIEKELDDYGKEKGN